MPSPHLFNSPKKKQTKSAFPTDNGSIYALRNTGILKKYERPSQKLVTIGILCKLQSHDEIKLLLGKRTIEQNNWSRNKRTQNRDYFIFCCSPERWSATRERALAFSTALYELKNTDERGRKNKRRGWDACRAIRTAALTMWITTLRKSSNRRSERERQCQKPPMVDSATLCSFSRRSTSSSGRNSIAILHSASNDPSPPPPLPPQNRRRLPAAM